MDTELKTVAIANAAGDDFIVINESDYNPAVHVLWVQPEIPPVGDSPAKKK